MLVENESVSSKAIMDDSDIAKYMEQAFKMYGGPVTDVTIKFEDSLISVAQDKFDQHANIVRTSPEKCVVSIQLQMSQSSGDGILAREKDGDIATGRVNK